MNCQECLQQLDEMANGRLEASVRAEIETHLRECVNCATAFAEERKLWDLLGSAASSNPSHGFADRVLRQLDAAPSRSWWLSWPAWSRWASVAAVFVISIAVTSLVLLQPDPQPAGVHTATNEPGPDPVKHFEELFTLVQNVDPDSVVNGPLYQNGNGETL